MKNRKKIPLPNPAELKRSEPHLARTRSEKSQNKIFSSASLQQNLEYFQKFSSFPKPLLSCGDADAYFKQSLRHYDTVDLTFLKKLSGRLSKPSKSTDTLKKKKTGAVTKQRCRHLTLKKPTSTRSQISQDDSSLSSPVGRGTSQPKKEREELDIDIYYSPSSRTSLTSTLKKKDSSDTVTEPEVITQAEDNTKEETMAEDEFIPEFDDEEDYPVADEPELETEEEEDDEMKEVEKMIQQASAELAEVTTENQQLLEIANVSIPEDDEEEGEDELLAPTSQPPEVKASGDGSIFTFDPAIDAAVLRELEDAEKQAKATAKIIYELKTRVTELLKKEKHSESEAKELEDKNKELKTQMLMFEEKTKRIQFLIAQTNLFDKMISPESPLQTRHNEDVLPKVVVCGTTENNIPKLLLCDEKKKCVYTCGSPTKKDVNIPMSVVPKFAKRLSDSYTMQEKLAAENADLEGMRYKLQADLLNKDQTIEYLQRKLCTIQCEMRLLCKENSVLNEKIQQICGQKQDCAKPKKMPCGKNKGPCPADIEGRLNEYSETTKLLEKQLYDMENDVKTMQTELTAVQAEREHLEQHKKVIICPPLCPHPCMPSPPCAPCIIPCSDQQLRELREQYCRLQDDFKSKVTEVGGLRADNEKLKTTAKDAEEAKRALEDRVKDLERQIKSLQATNGKDKGSREQLIELEQQLSVAKQRFREAQDELEELRCFIQDQQCQLDDYRNKYIEAQQQVEEQKRQIDMLEMDANRVNEQVNLEIQRVKNQFQEKLQELLPLPDLLKTTQLKLQEVQQMHLLAERNNEALNSELQLYKDKLAEITNKLDTVTSSNQLGENEKQNIATLLEQAEAKIKELEEKNFELRQDLAKTEESLDETERELQTKMHEIAQLSAQLECVREESARQVARNKDRCETVRRSLQNQISDLERQLAQSRAQARAAQKDRDEIRQKMQAQINNLHENFEDAQMRIRNLQGHVNILKETYTPPGLPGADAEVDYQDPCACGREF